jgi:hypothetical protein
VKFYSGFSLSGEDVLFNPFLNHGDFCVSGFSYGCIKAVEYSLSAKTRIDKLQLFSPSFFNTQDEKFKRLQLMFYSKDKQTYIKNFLQNVSYPSSRDLSIYMKEGTYDQLHELLFYEWDKSKIMTLLQKGILIEVYLGEVDKIINTKIANEFFKSCGCEVYFFKSCGHILQ